MNLTRFAGLACTFALVLVACGGGNLSAPAAQTPIAQTPTTQTPTTQTPISQQDPFWEVSPPPQ